MGKIPAFLFYRLLRRTTIGQC